MPINSPLRIGYVLKMYPRLSETFIVNEILAHEAAGLEIKIFSLRPPTEGRFHASLARVRAHVTYLHAGTPKSEDLWTAIGAAARDLPGGWHALDAARGEGVREVYQAILLSLKARDRGITHLHAHFGTVATTVARLASRLGDVPYSFTAHAKDIYHSSVRPDDLRRKLRDAAAAITVSDYNLRHLRETYGSDAARVQRVYNGLDLQQFTYSAPTKRRARIVAVGRLVEKKGFADLIDASSLLADRGHDFRCDIIGDGPLKENLRSRIQQRGLAEKVILRGARNHEEVIQRIGKAAVLAAPCVVATDGDRDGLPTVLVEAMAVGTPCVATDVTGIPEVVQHGKTGLLVPQQDPSALAGGLERIIGDSTLRVRLADEARRLIEAEFDIHRNTKQLRAVFSPTAPAHHSAQNSQETA